MNGMLRMHALLSRATRLSGQTTLGPPSKSILIRSTRNLRIFSTQGDTSNPEPSEQASRIQRPPPRPIPQGLKLERVERLEDEAWAGVASVDRGTQGLGLKDTLIVAGGDIGALVTFATIGRLSHGETLSVVESFGTAAPFIIGWVGASLLLTGAYGKKCVDAPLMTAAQTWVTGIPVGLLLRSILKGHLPETTFIMVSMAFTGVALLGWRSAFARFIATPLDSSLSASDQLKKRQNKRGNPFEFISLLLSLVKRW